MEGRLTSLIRQKGLNGGGDWVLLAMADGSGYVVLEDIDGNSPWRHTRRDELLLVGIGPRSMTNHFDSLALEPKAEGLVTMVCGVMNIKLRAKLESRNELAEGFVAQAAANYGLPMYQLHGQECLLIVPSDAHGAGEECISNDDLYHLTELFLLISQVGPELLTVLTAGASRLEMKVGEKPLIINIRQRWMKPFGNSFYEGHVAGTAEINGYQTANSPSAEIILGAYWRHGDIGRGEAPEQLPSTMSRTQGGRLFDLVDALAVFDLEAGRLPLAEAGVRHAHGITDNAHRIGQFGFTFATAATWSYNKLRSSFRTAVKVVTAEFSGLPLTTGGSAAAPAAQEALSDGTKKLIDTMAQIYAASIPACFASYPLLKDAPVHISSTIYGGLAFVTVILYIGMLSRSENRVRLAFRLASCTAITVLAVSFVSQLSGPTYVKVLSALAGAVLNLVIMLLRF